MIFNRDKERERYYLLPGMGGRARRSKLKAMFWWGVAGGLCASVLLAGVLLLIARYTGNHP